MAKLRAVAYMNLPKDIPCDADQSQYMEELYKQYAEKNGWDYLGAYKDYAGNRGAADRTGLQNIIADAHKGKFDIIIVYCYNRIHRNTAKLMKVVVELKECGVKLYSITEGGVINEEGIKIVLTASQLAKEAEDEIAKTTTEEYEEMLGGIEEMLGYMDRINHTMTDDIEKTAAKGIEIRVADKTIKLPLNDITYQAIEDALKTIQEEMQ